MSSQQQDDSRSPTTAEPVTQADRRGFLARISALVAGGLGLFGGQLSAKADEGDWDDDDGYDDGGYYYDPYYGGYYYYDDDGWDDDDDDDGWGDWDDDDWD